MLGLTALASRQRAKKGGLPATAGQTYISRLDTPLIQLSHDKRDVLTLDSLTRGMHWCGATGAGKTTAAANVALAFLKAGFGGIVLCAKPGEFDLWLRYTEAAGRAHQLVRFCPGGPRFNFLDYAIAADIAAGRGMVTMNIVNLLMKVLEAAQRGSELRGQAPEQPFWRLAPQALLDHTIDVLWGAYGTLRLPEIVEFILTVPRTEEEFQSETFARNSFHMRTIRTLVDQPAHRMRDHDLNVVLSYFRFDFGRLDDRTRSNITATMTSQFAPLLKGLMHSSFCTETTIAPEITFTAGAIIVLDFPVKTYGDAGMLAQHIFKLLWQKAVESRDVRAYDRPVFLWGDEAQFFITPYDIHFQTTARSSRACTVYLTQSYSNYYAAIGGANPRDATQDFLNNFNVKVFLANTDHNTNQAASEMIGRTVQLRRSEGRNSGGSSSSSRSYSYGTSFQSGSNWSYNKQSGVSAGGSTGSGTNESRSVSDSLSDSWGTSSSQQETMDYEVQPGAFARLQSGPDHAWVADAFIIEGGRYFYASKRHYLFTHIPMRRL